MVIELSELRRSNDRLSQLELIVDELEQENQGLQEDILDIKEMYRDQLDQLLEEKILRDVSVQEIDVLSSFEHDTIPKKPSM